MAPATDSLQAQLQAHRKEFAEEKTAEISIPGWDGTLVAKYGAMGWRDIRDSVLATNQSETKEVEEAADALLASSIGVEARVNGTSAELENLGAKLAAFLGLTGDMPPDLPVTDRAALFLIFQNGCSEKEMRTRLMLHFNQVMGEMQLIDEEADEEVAKN